MGPRVIGHFLQYLDIHCFYSLRDTSPLLEYAKKTLLQKVMTLLGYGILEMRKLLLGPSAPSKLFLCVPAYFSTTLKPYET